MDVYLETSKVEELLSVEIWFFDTVAEIKKKVHKYHGFPVSSQTLVFNGRVLQDDRDTEYYDILQNSRIQLFLPDDDLPPIRLKLTVNIPTSNSKRQLTLEASAADTVAQLKLQIHQLERNIPPDQFALFFGGVELVESNRLVHCNVAHGSEVELVLRPSSSRKLRVMVQIMGSNMKIPVEVSPAASVGQLRVELSDLDGKFNLQLPDEYFFGHNQSAMEDDKSFTWHNVKQGDTIDICKGKITSGLT